MDEAVQPTGRNRDPFPATRWSLIQRAGGHEHSVDRDEDWRQLFLAYRLPIECVLRRQLPGDALADAVAEFFSYLFEHRLLQRVDRSVGSFSRPSLRATRAPSEPSTRRELTPPPPRRRRTCGSP